MKFRKKISLNNFHLLNGISRDRPKHYNNFTYKKVHATTCDWSMAASTPESMAPTRGSPHCCLWRVGKGKITEINPR